MMTRSPAALLLVFFSVLMLLIAMSFTSTPPPVFPPPPRIFPTALPRLSQFRIVAPGRLVSIGDLHGDLAGLRDVLARTGLIDLETRSKWTGGNAVFVQTGDMVDRGEDSADVMRLLASLQSQALVDGGRVICLMGNHELINVVSDWRFVSDKENEGFGGSLSARQHAFSPQGEFGPWIRSLPVAVVVEQSPDSRTLFVHGGLDPYFLDGGGGNAEQVLAALDAHIATLLHRIDTKGPAVAYEEPLLGEHGPLWNRFFAMKKPESVVCAALNKTLQAASATRKVVGHTVQDNGLVGTRCSGALVLGDVGFSPYYNPPNGRRLAVEYFSNATWRVIGEDGAVF